MATALSPVGWVSLLGLTHVARWMVPASILGPLLCAFAVRSLPQGLKGSSSTRAAQWSLSSLILIYSFWSMASTAKYLSYTSLGGSSLAASLGSLGSIRSALDIYHQDNELYPKTLSELTVKSRYLGDIPEVHAISNGGKVLHVPSKRPANFPARRSDDRGGWGYVNEPLLSDGRPNPDFGAVFINCTHTDHNGRRMSDY